MMNNHIVKAAPKRRGSSPLLQIMLAEKVHKTVENRLILEYLAALDCPHSLSVWLLYKNEEYTQIVDMEVNPSDFLDGEAFSRALAAVSFLRKNSSLKTTYNKKARAIQAFKDAETVCETTNARLILNSPRNFLSSEDVSVLYAAKRKIFQILKSFDVDYFLDSCKWGPGNTLGIKGDDTSPSIKFDTEVQVTNSCADLFLSTMRKAYPTWEGLNRTVVVGVNKVITVPKNAKIDRTIAIEPGINSWVQLGIGRLIRKRLRHAGFDLNSDRKNQDIARRSSIDGLAATVDFKAASDTIAIETVRYLLPDRWFSILDSARSHYYTLNGDVIKYHKFSTMGNGFTFELESLIFVAIALAICEYNGYDDADVSIFGDDLTLPSLGYTQLGRICSYLGFTINTDKSFASGPFRESCGSYYFSGRDVKPYFLKKGLRFTKDLFRFANSTRHLAERRYFPYSDGAFRKVWNLAVHSVHPRLRVFGPMSSGDCSIHVSFDEATTRRPKDGHDCFMHSGFPDVALVTRKESLGLLLSKLHSPSLDGTSVGNDVPLRGRTRIVYKKNMRAYQWHNFGPWLDL